MALTQQQWADAIQAQLDSSPEAYAAFEGLLQDTIPATTAFTSHEPLTPFDSAGLASSFAGFDVTDPANFGKQTDFTAADIQPALDARLALEAEHATNANQAAQNFFNEVKGNPGLFANLPVQQQMQFIAGQYLNGDISGNQREQMIKALRQSSGLPSEAYEGNNRFILEDRPGDEWAGLFNVGSYTRPDTGKDQGLFDEITGHPLTQILATVATSAAAGGLGALGSQGSTTIPQALNTVAGAAQTISDHEDPNKKGDTPTIVGGLFPEYSLPPDEVQTQGELGEGLGDILQDKLDWFDQWILRQGIGFPKSGGAQGTGSAGSPSTDDAGDSGGGGSKPSEVQIDPSHAPRDDEQWRHQNPDGTWVAGNEVGEVWKVDAPSDDGLLGALAGLVLGGYGAGSKSGSSTTGSGASAPTSGGDPNSPGGDLSFGQPPPGYGQGGGGVPNEQGEIPEVPTGSDILSGRSALTRSSLDELFPYTKLTPSKTAELQPIIDYMAALRT